MAGTVLVVEQMPPSGFAKRAMSRWLEIDPLFAKEDDK
jgi:hypothetical protein